MRWTGAKEFRRLVICITSNGAILRVYRVRHSGSVLVRKAPESMYPSEGKFFSAAVLQQLGLERDLETISSLACRATDRCNGRLDDRYSRDFFTSSVC